MTVEQAQVDGGTGSGAATTVLYVAGTGRSGSTVLANALGELDGFVSVGELRYLWERGLLEQRLCGCGEPFGECPFWGRVVAVAFPGGPPSPQRMRDLLHRSTRMRVLPGLLLSGRSRRQARQRAAAADLVPALQRLYGAVREVSGAEVVVDSSKLPTYAALLDAVPGIDVRVVHLVRDPRAAAFSWRRRKVQPDRRTPGYMERRGAAKSVALWLTWNGAVHRLWRGRGDAVARIAYESFVQEPATALRAAASVAGVPVEASLARLLLDDRTLRLSAAHTVAGNPARLRHGPVELRLDDEWTTAMRRRDRWLVGVLAAPLMHSYGYGSRRPRNARGSTSG